MGLYSNNRTSLGNYDIPAVGNYAGDAGIATMALESVQEDMKFFDLIIANDFREAELVVGDRGYVTEATEEVITEGVLDTLKSAFKKFREFLSKIWAKIKSIFKSLYAKVEALFVRDNKKYAEKYKKEIFAKTLTDMKYKWATGSKFTDMLKQSTDKGAYADPGAMASLTAKIEDENKDSVSLEDLKKKLDEEYTDDLYALVSKENNKSYDNREEMRKDMFEEYIGDIEEKDTGADSLKENVYTYLMNGNKLIAKLKDIESKCDKFYSNELKKLTDAEKTHTKIVTDNVGTTDVNKKAASESASKTLAVISAKRRVITTIQSYQLDKTSIDLEIAKKELAICRAFWAKAVTYRKVVHNSALLNGIDEAAEYEVESSFGL